MLNIGIMCGGFSSEYDISIKSAKNVLKNISKVKYNPFLIYVKPNKWEVEYLGEVYDFSQSTMSFQYKADTIQLDAAHIYIHGNPGENGKLQAYLEMKNIPCINSGALSSELSFDKWFCNQFLKNFNIPIAQSILLLSKSELDTDKVVQELGLPCFIKPSDSGSSYGISKVYNIDELERAVDIAFEEGERVVIEAFLKGIEVTCAVYKTLDGINTLPCTEIVSHKDFFDYEAKYNGLSEEITPARISIDLSNKIQILSQNIYKLLQLKSIARIDFMIVNDIPHVIEVNTIPGFSNESIVPKMLAVADIPVSLFWDEIYAFELNQH